MTTPLRNQFRCATGDRFLVCRWCWAVGALGFVLVVERRVSRPTTNRD